MISAAAETDERIGLEPHAFVVDVALNAVVSMHAASARAQCRKWKISCARRDQE